MNKMNEKVTQESIIKAMRESADSLLSGIKYLEELTDSDKQIINEKKEMVIAAISEFNDRYADQSMIFLNNTKGHSDVADAVQRLFNSIVMYSQFENKFDIKFYLEESEPRIPTNNYTGKLVFILDGVAFKEDGNNIDHIKAYIGVEGDGKDARLIISDTCDLVFDHDETKLIAAEYCW